MIVKIKKISENAEIPSYKNHGDAGVDLVATNLKTTDKYLEYGTGLSIEVPFGYVGKIYPRSSISNTGLTMCNSVGIIDSGYRGELKVRFYQNSENIEKYKIGDRIAQLIIEPLEKVNFQAVLDLSDSERGSGGFGSTGN